MWKPLLRVLGFTLYRCCDCGSLYLRWRGYGHRHWRLGGRSCRLHLAR